MGIQSTPHWVSFGGWWFRFREVRNVVANPTPLCAVPISVFGVPPDVFLALGPRFAFGISRSTVIENMAVGGPGKEPPPAYLIFRVTPPPPGHAPFRHGAPSNHTPPHPTPPAP